MQEGWITASYNALNQPNAIWCPSYPGGALAQFMWFGFDPLGRCVKRWMGSETGHAPGSHPSIYYYYDGWNLTQEGPGGATADRTYVHGGRVDEIVASQAGGVWAYHHYDLRGHCILLTKASDGTILEQYDYGAFGYPYFHKADGGKLGSAFQFGNRFLFTGREWLKELRVYDYRNRIYQPELGRFLQPDPTGFEGDDYNLYRYCHNDPVNKSDPTGLVEDFAEDFRWKTACFFDSGNSFNGSYGEYMGNQQAQQANSGEYSGVANWETPTGNWKEPNVEKHVVPDGSMGGGDVGRTYATRPKVVPNSDGSLSVRSDLKWDVEEFYEHTRVSLAEVDDHVRSWRNWQTDPQGEGYRAVKDFRFTGPAQDAANKLQTRLLNESIREQARQWRDFHANGRHSLDRNPKLKEAVDASTIETAVRSLP